MPRNIESRESSPEKYPQDFIDRVKAAIPDYEELNKALDEGNNYFVERVLNDSMGLRMDPADIVKAFEDGKQDEVLGAAKSADAIEKLYEEFCDMTMPQEDRE